MCCFQSRLSVSLDSPCSSLMLKRAAYFTLFSLSTVTNNVFLDYSLSALLLSLDIHAASNPPSPEKVFLSKAREQKSYSCSLCMIKAQPFCLLSSCFSAARCGQGQLLMQLPWLKYCFSGTLYCLRTKLACVAERSGRQPPV